MKRCFRASVSLIAAMMLFFMTSCMSAYKKKVGGETEQVFTRIYLTDFNTAWQAALEALKSHPLDASNREAGHIRTKWKDNTANKNFIDSFGIGKTYLKAQFRYTLSVAEGFFDGKPSVKVSVQREQMVQNDVLEGWRPVETDSIEENTLLYRIARLIVIKTKLAADEDIKTQKAVDAFMQDQPEQSTE